VTNIVNPPDAAHRAMLTAEFTLILWLEQNNGLNAEGMHLAHWLINQPNDVLTATGAPLHELREDINDELAAKMSGPTGIGQAHLAEQPPSPESSAQLPIGVLTALRRDQRVVIPRTAKSHARRSGH